MTYETEEKYGAAKAELIEKFKSQMKLAAESVLSDLYTDVSLHAAGDDFQNYRNVLQSELSKSFTEEISDKFGHYSWAHGIRMKLMEAYPEKIQNKIIEDLQGRIKSLEEHIEQMRRYRS